MIDTVIKRNGSKVTFDKSKITIAISKAFFSLHRDIPADKVMKKSEEFADLVVEKLNALKKTEASVEEIQNIVEPVLMEVDPSVAKSYILYRQQRAEIRAFKANMGIPDDDLKMPINSLTVLAARYLLKDANGKIIETPKQLFQRVCRFIASAEKTFNKSNEEIAKLESDFYDALTSFKFMPNSPTLMNSATSLGQLSACFVIPVGDSIEEIFDAVKYTAIIHKTGGGTGFSFSRLRPTSDAVRSTGGIASGPLSFMKVFDAATDVIKQGGKRRGANMGILRVDHPDILDFIVSKEKEGVLKNFNISVGITDVFMKAVKENRDYPLLNPRTGNPVRVLNARAVWNLIVTMAWKTGDPGLVYLDRINSSISNPVPRLGPIESTNPCITGDTLVYTKLGLATARELYDSGEENEVVVDGRFASGTRRSSKMMMTGIKPVIKVVTREGFEVRVTGDHKIYSDKKGWIKASEIEPGERIRVLSSGGTFGLLGNASEGRVLGWLVGDGHINRGPGNKKAVLSFYDKDAPLAESFAMDVNEVIRPAFTGRNSVGVVTLENRNMKFIASERLKEFAIEHGLSKSKLIVSDCVLKGNLEMQRGFLQALFEADGTVSDSSGSRRSVRLTSISNDLLKQVQMLLLNFGVYSKIYFNRKHAGTKAMPGPDRKPKLYNVQSVHELSIDGSNLFAFKDRIGFIGNEKSEKLHRSLEKYSKGPYNEDWVATVASAEEDGVEEVFDLIEPDTHSFIANGIVVHNCGEQPLYPYDSCNLGSINLAQMIKQIDDHFDIDWDELKRMIYLGVRFLDNTIEMNHYPIPQIDAMTRSIRRIGLGVMGWADMLIKLGVKYDSNEALLLAEELMSFITNNARKASEELAVERGPFPEFKNSIWARLGFKPLRNANVTTIAPTGTISIIAGGTSQSIEPMFSVVYMRNVHESLGSNLIEINNEFEHLAIEKGFYSEQLMRDLAGRTSIQDVEEVPKEIRRLFVTAHDIAPEWHIKMQAAFQKYTDAAVSKTINLPSTATPQDVENAYWLSYELGCKGITIYRDMSKSAQPLQTMGTPKQRPISEIKKDHESAQKQTMSITAIRSSASDYMISPTKESMCPDCGTVMIAGGGCFTCPKCGQSVCGG